MIKEGKERVIVTLEKDIFRHLFTWIMVKHCTKSELINLALYCFFTSQGDTFDKDVRVEFEFDKIFL